MLLPISVSQPSDVCRWSIRAKAWIQGLVQKRKRITGLFVGMKQIGFYPLVTYKIAIENDPVEIVDFPIKDGTLMGFN